MFWLWSAIYFGLPIAFTGVRSGLFYKKLYVIHFKKLFLDGILDCPFTYF